MRVLNSLFEDKNIDYDKLLEYGFVRNDDMYIFEKNICDDTFKVIVQISSNKQTAKIMDLQTDEEYVMVDIKNAVGAFVGAIRSEYDKVIVDIIEKCTTKEAFKAEQSKLLIKYVTDKYGDNLEFLWEKFPKDAIIRNKNNNKWYVLLLYIPKNRLGIESDEMIEIIDLRYQKDKTKDIIDNKTIFPGYHMNKNSWITIMLDNSVEIKEIYDLIDNSYNLSISK